MRNNSGRPQGQLKKSKPKSTLMDKRATKPANKTGKGAMVYPSGKHA